MFLWSLFHLIEKLQINSHYRFGIRIYSHYWGGLHLAKLTV